jgi:hypothetical protein
MRLARARWSRSRLLRDCAGGTGFLELVILVALLAFVVIVGVRAFGGSTDASMECRAGEVAGIGSGASGSPCGTGSTAAVAIPFPASGTIGGAAQTASPAGAPGPQPTATARNTSPPPPNPITTAIGAVLDFLIPPAGAAEMDRPPPPPPKLGSLSEKYETSGRGAGTVSTGRGDPGGVSYGSYQMTSKSGCTVCTFVSSASFPWRDDFRGLQAGSGAFSQLWKRLAAEEPERFRAAQHEFIKETHYDLMVRKVKGRTGVDIDELSPVVRDAVWSTAVHHGPGSQVVDRAIERVPPDLRPGDPDYDKALLEEIYGERGRQEGKGRLVYFTKVSPRVRDGLKNRFRNELRDALDRLGREPRG